MDLGDLQTICLELVASKRHLRLQVMILTMMTMYGDRNHPGVGSDEDVSELDLLESYHLAWGFLTAATEDIDPILRKKPSFPKSRRKLFSDRRPI